MTFLQWLALLATTTLFSGVSAQPTGCPDDPDSDLCAGMGSSPSPAGSCPDDPDSDLCDLKRPGACPDDPESDLCDGKVWMPCPDDPDVDLCSPSPSPSPSPTPDVPSPSPSPTPEVPSPSPSPTAEVPSPSPSPTPDAPSPSPSPSPDAPSPSPSPTPDAPSPSPSPTPDAPVPSPSPTPEDITRTTTTTTAIVKVASFDTSLEMDDVTKFDADTFVESVTSSQEGAEEVVVESVSYQVEVEYTLPETMTETNVQEAIAAAQGVAVENVNASKKPARRLAASLRRLTAAWNVIIKTSNASAVDSIASKAGDKEAIQAAAQDLGISGVTVEVASPPKKKVAVQFKVKSKPNAAEAVQTVDATELSKELGDKLGVEVTVRQVDFKGEEEEIKSAPTQAPAPTTSLSSEDEDDSGTKTLPCIFAFQLVLVGTVAGLQL